METNDNISGNTVNVENYINNIPDNTITDNTTTTNNLPFNTEGVLQDTYLNFGNATHDSPHGQICPGPFIPNDTINYSGITTPEDLFINNPKLFNSSSIKEIKEKVLEIFLKKSDFEDKEYDELNYENEEIDNFVTKIDSYNIEFKRVQSELEKADGKLKGEIKIMNDNLKKLDHFIDFVDKLGTNIDEEDKEALVSQINKISEKLSKPEQFIQAKKSYVEQRKKLLKYIYLFRKVNKWNVANMCGICLENPVDHFIDPCGHTFCKGCIKEQFKVDEIDEIRIYSHRNNLKCPVCRQGPVNTAKPLYFL